MPAYQMSRESNFKKKAVQKKKERNTDTRSPTGFLHWLTSYGVAVALITGASVVMKPYFNVAVGAIYIGFALLIIHILKDKFKGQRFAAIVVALMTVAFTKYIVFLQEPLVIQAMKNGSNQIILLLENKSDHPYHDIDITIHSLPQESLIQEFKNNSKIDVSILGPSETRFVNGDILQSTKPFSDGSLHRIVVTSGEVDVLGIQTNSDQVFDPVLSNAQGVICDKLSGSRRLVFSVNYETVPKSLMVNIRYEGIFRFWSVTQEIDVKLPSESIPRK